MTTYMANPLLWCKQWTELILFAPKEDPGFEIKASRKVRPKRATYDDGQNKTAL
jgi:hypothetical protein